MADFHKPGELGLTRETFFVVRLLELASVAVLLWFWWCVLSAAGFLFFCCFVFIMFSLRTRTAYGMYQTALAHLPLY